MNIRKGFDTSPLLDREFAKATLEHIRSVAPESLDPNATDTPELLVNSVKRIHKTPTPAMLLEAHQKTQLPTKQILEVWDAMWARA